MPLGLAVFPVIFVRAIGEVFGANDGKTFLWFDCCATGDEERKVSARRDAMGQRDLARSLAAVAGGGAAGQAK